MCVCVSLSLFSLSLFSLFLSVSLFLSLFTCSWLACIFIVKKNHCVLSFPLCVQCHSIHRQLVSSFKYAVVWVSVSCCTLCSQPLCPLTFSSSMLLLLLKLGLLHTNNNPALLGWVFLVLAFYQQTLHCLLEASAVAVLRCPYFIPVCLT